MVQNPTAAELKDLSLACSKLWDLDANRLTANEDYQINLQRGKKPYQTGDLAPENLFTFVKEEVLQSGTFKLFYDLLDNYERGTGVAEVVTAEEKRENWDFLNAISETAPIQYCLKWLVQNKKFSGNMSDFKRKLHDLWFALYRREVRGDSSGFEHVFVGEEKDGKVTGCHNWIQIYNEERKGLLDYLGYIKPKQRGCGVLEPHEKEQLITIQFSWENEMKPVSSSLIGVSPEFEIALYTMCFMNGAEDNEVNIGPYRCNIKCYAIGRGDRAKIGTAFPEALPMTTNQAASKIQSQFRGRQTRKKTNSNAQSRAPPAPVPGQPKQSAWGQPKKW